MTDPHLDLESARWARARDDYRAGLSAAEVCARHGLARSTFHARAHAGRWRRCDLAPSAGGAALPEADDFDPAATRRSAFDMADLAHRRLSHAVEKGRLREALGWARLARELRELTPEEEEGRSWRRVRREQLAAASAEPAAQPTAQAQAGAKPSPGPACVAPTTTPSQGHATARAAGAWDMQGSGFASDAVASVESTTASPARIDAQEAEDVEETPLTLDSPDTFDALNAVLPPALFAELLQDMAALRSGDPAHADDWAAWEAMRCKLKAARPDLTWWEGTGEDDDDEAADFIFDEDAGLGRGPAARRQPEGSGWESAVPAPQHPPAA